MFLEKPRCIHQICSNEGHLVYSSDEGFLDAMRFAQQHCQQQGQYYQFLRKDNGSVEISFSQIEIIKEGLNKGRAWMPPESTARVDLSRQQIRHLRYGRPRDLEDIPLNADQMRILKSLSMTAPETFLKYGLDGWAYHLQ